MSNNDKLKPGKYAILFRNNWDGEGDTYETFAILDAKGIWRDEDGDELLEYQGDEVLSAWPMDDGSNVLALLDELEAAEKRIAELSASHGKLREAMAGIHNTIRGEGAYTPLAAILSASKRAYEESASAAGKGE
ncbi:hypothetical protein UXO11_00235 [Enterobacter wuhouensis]|uniref:hypothetical protein n=1 Tax=Enterobacter wuhouensis TaxID=2529381 RepID=UPI002FD6CA11